MTKPDAARDKQEARTERALMVLLPDIRDLDECVSRVKAQLLALARRYGLE